MNKRKILAIAVAVMLVAAFAVGGTLAWLATTTQTVQNTFAPTNIDITLAESDSADADTDANTNSYDMVPGSTIAKDPKVTVVGGSVKCWLFVEIVESSTLDTYISYTVSDNNTEDGADWQRLDDDSNVWYRVVDANAENQTFDILSNNSVTVNWEVTKAQMDELEATGAIQPTLTFKAYAVQYENISDVNNAWTQASSTEEGYYNTDGANTANAYTYTPDN